MCLGVLNTPYNTNTTHAIQHTLYTTVHHSTPPHGVVGPIFFSSSHLVVSLHVRVECLLDEGHVILRGLGIVQQALQRKRRTGEERRRKENDVGEYTCLIHALKPTR